METEVKQKTKLEIIEETWDYYSVPGRKAIMLGQCMYITSTGNMCAVGRCLAPNDKIEKLVGSASKICIKEGGVSEPINLEEWLKPEYRGHEMDFWVMLQRLHDEELVGDGWGPTAEIEKNRLIELWCND